MLLTALRLLGTWGTSVWRWMTRDGHWKLVVAAMTAATIILLVHSYRASLRETAALKVDVASAKGEVVLLDQARASDSAATLGVSQAKAAIAHTEAEQRVKTDAALRAHPDWANEPIPTDVINSLSL